MRPAAEPIVLSYRETAIFMSPHAHTVTALAFSPDGRWLASGSADGFLRWWDAATGALKCIRGDDATRGIHGLAISPDGARVAAVGGLLGEDVELWGTSPSDVERSFAAPVAVFNATPPARESAPFLYKNEPIEFCVRTAVAFADEGRTIVAAPDSVVLRDAATGKPRPELPGAAKGVQAVAVSPRGNLLAAASADRKVRVWNLSSSTLESTLSGASQPLKSIAISPDGSRLVGISSAQRSILDSKPQAYLWWWNLRGGDAQKLDLGSVSAGQVAFSGPSQVVFAAGPGLWSIDLTAPGAPRSKQILASGDDLVAVAVSPDQRIVACGGRDRQVQLVELSSGKVIWKLAGLLETYSAVATSADGKWIATASIDRRFTMWPAPADRKLATRHDSFLSGENNAGRMQASQVYVWNADDARLQTTLQLDDCLVTAVDFVAGGNQLAVASWTAETRARLSLWDAASGRHVRDLSQHAADILSIAVSPDSHALVSGDVDGALCWWDPQSGEKRRTVEHERPIVSVAFAGNGKILAAADADDNARVYDATSGAVLKTLKCRAPIEAVDVSPDGNLVSIALRGPGLELWGWEGKGATRTLKEVEDWIEPLCGFATFSPDGRLVTCRGIGKDIAVFDVATGKLLCELRGHEHPPSRVAFLPDGRLVSGGDERAVRLWDVERRSLLASWYVLPADAAQGWQAEWIGFTPEGTYIGSQPLARLVGWEKGGNIVLGPSDHMSPRRVERLLQRVPAPE